ncbi:hypothetical protein NEOLEDRAFT_1031957, partial [Neolentinus lepideus HHB14362 ss-1]
IGGIFTSLSEQFHYRVFDFDKVVCKWVGNLRSILLTEYNIFNNLQMSHLSDHG